MKLLWQSKFDGFDLVRTSPLYYKATVEKKENALNCYFFDRGVGIKSVSFDTQTGQIITHSKDGKIQKKHRSDNYVPDHLSCDDFVFGEYTISHHGEWGYACKKNGQLLWKKSLKGYLYTEIILDQGNIVFGTAGQGGHFYSLNIDTGEIVFDFNTMGTSIFFDVNNNYYFCATNKKNTQIHRIDHDGNVLETIEIEGAYYDYMCLFEVCDDLLCVMTLKKKRKGYDEFFSPIFYCVQL